MINIKMLLSNPDGKAVTEGATYVIADTTL